MPQNLQTPGVPAKAGSQSKIRRPGFFDCGVDSAADPDRAKTSVISSDHNQKSTYFPRGRAKAALLFGPRSLLGASWHVSVCSARPGPAVAVSRGGGDSTLATAVGGDGAAAGRSAGRGGEARHRDLRPPGRPGRVA